MGSGWEDAADIPGLTALRESKGKKPVRTIRLSTGLWGVFAFAEIPGPQAELWSVTWVTELKKANPQA